MSKARFIFLIYLLLLHGFVIIVLLKTNTPPKILSMFGYEIQAPELSAYYYGMTGFHKRIDKNVPELATIFVGDSLVQGLAVSAISPLSVNFGIGLDTTHGVITRISQYQSIKNARVVVVAIGHNDLKWRDDDQIVRNYLKIIELIPARVPILFSAILPVDEYIKTGRDYNARIAIINSKLQSICDDKERLKFLDISTYLSDSKGNLLPRYHIGDGVHLNALGNGVWISELKKKISSLPQQ